MFDFFRHQHLKNEKAGSLNFRDQIHQHVQNSYLVVKTWRLLWNFFSREDLGEGGVGSNVACAQPSDNETRRQNEAEREVRREGRGRPFKYGGYFNITRRF